MLNLMERYQNLGLKEALLRIYQYPIACKELSFILRGAYNKVSKNVQSLIFQDTLAAFRLLPQHDADKKCCSAAHLLLQSAEASLPKQKKNLAVTEFKHAMVAYKRRCKARKEAEVSGSVQLPQDVLIHIFSFLDMPSLVSVGLVSWSWNLAASDNHLWQSQYAIFFGNSGDHSRTKTIMQRCGRVVEDKKHALLLEDIASQTCIDWREAFKRRYIGNSSKKLTSKRGFCGHCDVIVWLNNLKCSNGHDGLKSQNHKIKLMSPSQVVEYLLGDHSSIISSSESDSESDEESVPSLWAYPKHLQM